MEQLQATIKALEQSKHSALWMKNSHWEDILRTIGQTKVFTNKSLVQQKEDTLKMAKKRVVPPQLPAVMFGEVSRIILSLNIHPSLSHIADASNFFTGVGVNSSFDTFLNLQYFFLCTAFTYIKKIK